jgi:hypothetical protein
MNILEIRHSEDDEGTRTVEVPLKNSNLKAELYEQDYAELVALGAGLPWHFKQNQVVVWKNPKSINIARLILDADKGVKVSFLDSNSRNLRRSNLIRVAGSSKYRSRDQLEPTFRSKIIEERHITNDQQ